MTQLSGRVAVKISELAALDAGLVVLAMTWLPLQAWGS
jgi:hypothetical protein